LRIRERDVVAPRPDPLLGQWIALDERLHRAVIALHAFLEIVSHSIAPSRK